MAYVVLIGRILYSMIFIIFGLFHFMNLQGMSQYAASQGVPAPTFMTIVTGIMLVVGGLSILLGYKPKIGAWLIFLFLVPTAFLMHNFWAISDPMQSQNQMAHFMKNLSMAGAALLIAYFGSGPLSLEKSAESGE